MFKTQTRPVNFPLITLHSSQSKATHCIFPFISPVPLRQRQEWVFKGGMRVVVRGGAKGGGDSQAESLIFAPGVCAAAAAAAAVALSLSED